MVLIDLQKAFDIIYHKILLKKYFSVGFSPQSIVWFECYLSNRRVQLSPLFGLNVTSQIGEFKPISRMSSSMVLTSTVAYPKDLFQSLDFLFFLIYVNGMFQTCLDHV